jgi:hypothetical protein
MNRMRNYTSIVASAIAGLALACNSASAQSFDDPPPPAAKALPAQLQADVGESLGILTHEELANKLSAQAAARRIAAEAVAYIQANKKTAAAKRIRTAVRTAMSWHEDSYADFIAELNEQLETRNVFQALGLHQRPHAAMTPEQYKAELDLYGQRTVLASVLATIGPEAIRQGTLQDCWFLSTLAVVADDYPWLIPSMISVNADASYVVKFPGYANKIHVKPLEFNATKAVGARSTEFGEWPFVLECAATALFPDNMKYGGHPNVALKLLTGIDSTKYSLIPGAKYPMLTGSTLNETVVAALETNQAVMLISPPDGPLVRNHAYSVIDVVPANEEHGAMITIRNPWGRLGFDPASVHLPDVQPGADGRFTVPIVALSKYFDDIVVPKHSLRVRNSLVTADQIAPPPPVNPALPALQRQYFNTNNGGNGGNTALPRVPRSYIRGR